MRRTPYLPSVPPLADPRLSDLLNRMRQALMAMTDENGIIEGGSEAYFQLAGNNVVPGGGGVNLFTGTNTFQGLAVFSGGYLAVENNYDLSRNNVAGMVLGNVNSQDEARFGGVWATVGFRAAPTDGDHPEDVTVTFLDGGAVFAEWSNQFEVVPLSDTVPRAHRFSGAYAPARQLAGVIVSDSFPQGAWVVRKGMVERADWTALTGAADLTPGAVYFVTYATGDSGAGTYTTTPTPWPVGRAINARRLYVDIDGIESSELVWLSTAGDVLAGQPVYPSAAVAGQLELAAGDDLAHQARLIALSDGVAGDVIPCSARPCVVVRQDWTDVAGVATLTAGDVYWLDNAGTGHLLALAADLDTGAPVQQELAYALDGRALLFDVRQPAASAVGRNIDGGSPDTVFGPTAGNIDGGAP